jgi:RNase H-fold protein (predicted Holliday junction resolvase)
MRIAGLDVSKNRIGLAFSDEESLFVAHSFLITKNQRENLQKYYDKYKPELTIVGLTPFGKNRNYIKSFCHNMRNIIQPFEFVDELNSSILAERFGFTEKSTHLQINKDEFAARLLVFHGIKRYE